MSESRWVFDRLQVEDEIDTILDTVPRGDYTNEEVAALAVVLRPIFQRMEASIRPPGVVLHLCGGA
ncbi:hypothetical protein [Mycolicibacterium fortuitum]|uniref:hypothetical protein n=1 Tax=Mycolicibacterium fortuitum TaxID=1766 RepID=UPI0007E96522|nr:hypothetical protein [Mycolicibacterium fortuitum]OBB35257.1 hypothetical protein A5763_00415 [Mycolicibacterium fortuitum]OBB41710.1 hypothetical protein A5754_16740 [Mycolicibacterium fortuitum]OBB63171.1 hypothetical protein A5755_21910 [Mycolicibacterium fortuitum]OBF87193.1 hypothetical protein A5751_07505 [Mycolicibacterium fortuitum]